MLRKHTQMHEEAGTHIHVFTMHAVTYKRMHARTHARTNARTHARMHARTHTIIHRWIFMPQCLGDNKFIVKYIYLVKLTSKHVMHVAWPSFKYFQQCKVPNRTELHSCFGWYNFYALELIHIWGFAFSLLLIWNTVCMFYFQERDYKTVC